MVLPNIVRNNDSQVRFAVTSKNLFTELSINSQLVISWFPLLRFYSVIVPSWMGHLAHKPSHPSFCAAQIEFSLDLYKIDQEGIDGGNVCKPAR